MKMFLPILLGLSICSASAEFRTWTRNDGKTAELDLVSVSGEGDAKEGEFRMRNGRTVTLKSSVLSEADAKLLDEWKPVEATESGEAAASVFDEILDGNLVKLSGKSLRTFRDLEKPTKYYVFYYTASWCGPCQKYTPTLVDFYNKNKNGNFEIILITSDSDEGDMEDYAEKKKMPWPQLKLKRVAKFKKEFKHGVSGIPSVITCDLEGKIVSRAESIPQLEALLK